MRLILTQKKAFDMSHRLTVITGSGDGVVRCYDAKSGHLLRTYGSEDPHEGAVMSMHVAKDRIYTATINSIIRVYQIDWPFLK